MESIDFNALSKEMTDILEKEKLIVLATTSDDKVTARTICHVNDGLDIYFGTSNTSQKYEQINTTSNNTSANENTTLKRLERFSR